MSSKKEAYTGKRPDIENIVPRDAKFILDAGCSNGTLGHSLLEMDSKRTVIGIEFDPDLASEAKRKLTSVHNADLNNFQWNKYFSNHTFDCIIFADVLEHLIDPWTILSEAKKHLTPKGCIIVSLPNIRHISAIYSIFFRGTFPTRQRGIFDKTHLRWFTLADARWLCTQADLSVETISYNLRISDKPEGKMNQFITYLEPIKNFYPIKQFFSYQFIIKASKN